MTQENNNQETPIIGKNGENLEIINPPSVSLANKTTFRKINGDELEDLGLKPVDGPTLHTAINNATGEPVYLLQDQNAVFLVSDNHAVIEELKTVVADTILQEKTVIEPIKVAWAIKKALKDGGGYKSEMTILQLIEFGRQAMQSIIDFKKTNIEKLKLDIQEAGLIQLRKDMSLGRMEYALLPKFRKINAAILSEIIMVNAGQNIIDEDTVSTAEDIKQISIKLQERKKELTQLMAETYLDAGKTGIIKTSEATKKAVENIISIISTSSNELVGTILKLVLGKDAVDEGALKSLLMKSGPAGKALVDISSSTGTSLKKLIKNIIAKEGNIEDSSYDSFDDEDEFSGI